MEMLKGYIMDMNKKMNYGGTVKKMMGGRMTDKPIMMKDMSLAEMAAAFPKDMYKHAKGAVKGIRKGIKEVTGYAKGGKMPMVKKDGKSVPAFAADGVGKMNMGGMVGYKKGGKIDGMAIKGKTKGRMC
jgi:hypothetical protein